MRLSRLLGALIAAGIPLPAWSQTQPQLPASTEARILPQEHHLRNLRQATFGGENAEAYWSANGRYLTLQSTTKQDRCDQIYVADVGALLAGSSQGASLRRLTDGKGRTTCSYFFPDASRVLFSSTRHIGEACPPPPDRSKGYVWPLYNYQIYTARPDGSDLRRLTQTNAYDAEATICHDGSVVFTSDRDGDLELYRMRVDGTGLTRLTRAPGYDGGAFFSEDCKRIVWRADRPRSEQEQAQMKDLLRQRLVRPSRMEIWVADADGNNAHQVTDLGGASFAPYFFPAAVAGAPSKRIIFSSNHHDPRHREFDLWAINEDGSGLERITYSPDFDGFPMFSPDGKRLAFASNRGGKARGETNVFIADWIEQGPRALTQTRAATAAEHVAWLADPAREGRGVGTQGLSAAAEQIARWMAEIGLQPVGPSPRSSAKAKAPSFFQPVDVFIGVRDMGSRFRLQSRAGVRAVPLPASQVTAASMSESGTFGGPLSFAGYGITAPEAGWDDLSGLNVKDQVVLVLRGVPEGRFSAGAARAYSDLRYKAWNLREHGARAVLFVDPEHDAVPALTLDGPEGGAGVFALHISRQAVAGLLPAPADPALPALREAAARGQSSQVSLAGTFSGTVSLKRDIRSERNVIGVLRGSDGPTAGAIVLGAHYDHLGLGGRGSFLPDQRVVHPGADDNASGTAALLAAAAALARKDVHPLAQDVYFIAFTGEEVGLVGSSRFLHALPAGLAADRIRAMINFDMVGRLGSQKGGTLPAVVIQGTDSAKEWPALVTPLCQAAALSCKLGGDGYGPSDMTPFYAAGIPVLFFFTGAHADYHRPSDTPDKINAMGIVQVADLAVATVRSLSTSLATGGALTYKKADRPMPRQGDSRGYGAYLGTIPDYTAMQGQKGGVRLSGARPGSPAEKAGLVGGDVLVGLGSHAVQTLEDMAMALRSFKPGQQIEVVILREGKRVVSQVVLGQRP
jgi:Tol biopolymer transport system component